MSGLRVLCGIGGKERFAARYRERSTELLHQGYRLGSTNSWFEAVSTCLPLVFLAAVTWIAARLTLAGEISVGEMVAVYGYVAALIGPVFFLVEAAGGLTHGDEFGVVLLDNLIEERRLASVAGIARRIDKRWRTRARPLARHGFASGCTNCSEQPAIARDLDARPIDV